MKPMVGEAGASSVAAYYENLQNSKEYPSKFNPEMNGILEKLPVEMTSLSQWASDNRDFFIK
ncbi:hypothetical protein D3C71_1987370 [compost metagenome]